ncbi:MAG: OmpH family outer membrane protein, partial [Bacteroidota bacterium]
MIKINKAFVLKGFLSTLFIGIFLSGLLVFVGYRIPKVGYIDNYELFDQFHGKIELEKRLTDLENNHKVQLDSMKVELLSLKGSANIDEQIIHQKEQLYYQVNQNFLEQYQDQSEEFTAQIWKQINKYVQEFGEQYHYDFIYGLQGDGNLMYGNSK